MYDAVSWRVIAVRHAADDGIFVGLFGQQRQQFADADPGNIGFNRAFERAAIIIARLRLGVERVQMRRAAPHPDLDDRLGAGGAGTAYA